MANTLKSTLMTFFLVLFVSGFVFAQPGKPNTTKYSVNSKMDNPFYSGLKGDSAYCVLNNGVLITHVSATMSGDTVYIELSENTPAFFHKLVISIAKDEFSTHYTFTYPDSSETMHVLPTDQVLMLSKSGLKKGDLVKAYINFRGTISDSYSNSTKEWSSINDWVKSDFTIRGPFYFKVN